jgi:hypothetical protein
MSGSDAQKLLRRYRSSRRAGGRQLVCDGRRLKQALTAQLAAVAKERLPGRFFRSGSELMASAIAAEYLDIEPLGEMDARERSTKRNGIDWYGVEEASDVT